MQISAMFGSALLGLLALSPLTSAHTWVEQLMAIAPNGTLVGAPGYARGNYMRSTPGFGDPTMVNLIPPDGRPANQILPSDLMCKSSQTSQTQSNGSPRLQAAAGDGVALRYQENGHVTLPDNQPGKPQNRGTVYVYGTSQASADDSFLAIHRVWTADGTGGDGRGRLLSTRNFDDGQCYQTNGGALSQQRQGQFSHPFDMLMGNDLWCQQDIQLPSDIPTGQPYTLYWVWDWPTMPGTAGFPQGKQEIYTTCMDVDIVGDTGIVPVGKSQVSFAQGQPLDNAAVSAQMSDLANPTAVTGQTIPFSNMPTTFLTQTATSKSSLKPPPSPSLTSSTSTGSSIAFSASATGPVAGGASEASVSAATASSTGVPDFLSVHTGSTAGPGIETQTFTVLPISAAGGNGGSGHGGNNGPQVTGAPNAVGNNQVATFTQYESVYETVLVTQYVTQYTKRDVQTGESHPVVPVPTSDGDYPPAPSQVSSAGGQPFFNHTHTHGHPSRNNTFWTFGRPSSINGSHPTGPSPWNNESRPSATGRPSGLPTRINGTHPFFNGTGRPSGPPGWMISSATGYPSGRPTAWPQWNNNSRPGFDGNDNNDFGAASTTTTTSQTTVTVQSTVMMTMTMPSASSNIVLPMEAAPNSNSESFSTTSTLTMTMTITPTATSTPVQSPSGSTSLSSSSSSTPKQALTISPLPDPAPTPAPSPTTSTDHPSFRLRARNPFVMLGWMSEPKTTST